MRFYTSVHQYGNKILVRGMNDGKKVQEKIDFKPSLFVKAKNKTEYTSLYGDFLERIQFSDINSAKDYVTKFKDVHNFPIFGNTNYAYQYITETFPNDVEFDMSLLKIYTIDIETTAENGFPDVNNPIEKVILITIQDNFTKQITTFGLQDYKNKTESTYYYCETETTLLSKFLKFIGEEHPHIFTGWNIEFFDIPYLCSRIIKILGEDAIKSFSPWNIVKSKTFDRSGKTELTYDIVGVAILDYLDLYKKFTYNAQESYKLDHIAKVELGVGKNDNPYDTFKDFYTKAWDKFVEYNIVDVQRVDQLEDKMRLIELILTMAYDAKCNYVDIFSAVRTWDCLLYNHLWKQKIIVQQKENRQGRQIVGAYVKEPIPGKYSWVVSFDATSLYPSIIMQYNMSPETIVSDYVDHFDIKISDLLDNKVDTSDLSDKNYCMAANGRCYTREKQGLFPNITAKLFADRQKYKKLMLASQAKYEETKDNLYLKEVSKYNNRQMAYKILLNSLFGAWGNEFFRFYNADIAEGITLTGQYVIQRIGKSLNEYLNKICGTENYDYSFYSDTDSCYVTFDPLVEKFYKNMPKEKVIYLLDKICKDKIEKELNKECIKLAADTNAFEQKIFFKREAIADSGLWIAKKRYALNVYNNEGVQYKEPKLKVMGLEIVRSSTPEPVRHALKDAVKLVLNSGEKDLQKFIAEFEMKFSRMPAEDIAFPRTCNGVEKYSDRSNIYKLATPIHVRGSLLYNFYLKKNNLDKKYQEIKEGDKIKFIYLKEPNTIGENCIAFIAGIPVELDLHKYVDYSTMFDKAFLEPLTTILNSVRWSAKPIATLDGLFV